MAAGVTVPGRHQIALPASGKAPSGRPLCRWCKAEILTGSGRRKWCGQKCINEYLVRKDPSSARRQVFARDHGVCAVCHVDTECVRRIRKLLWQRQKGYVAPVPEPWYVGQERVPSPAVWWDRSTAHARWERFATWIQQNVAASGEQATAHLWEADHIVPVAEGGGTCGLDNLRTLCKRCHGRETGALRRRINRARSAQQPLPGAE